MKVTLAKTAGFCFGVDRAVSLVEEAVAAGKRVSTLGPIIHNRHVMDHFAAEGVRELSEPEEAAAGTTVVIRSHGVSRDVYERLSRRGVEIVDATCPFVKRIHKLVIRAEAQGRVPVIIGTPTHPEVQAIAGWCAHPHVFEGPEALENWLREDPSRAHLPLTLVSQTTSTQNLW